MYINAKTVLLSTTGFLLACHCGHDLFLSRTSSPLDIWVWINLITSIISVWIFVWNFFDIIDTQRHY